MRKGGGARLGDQHARLWAAIWPALRRNFVGGELGRRPPPRSFPMLLPISPTFVKTGKCREKSGLEHTVGIARCAKEPRRNDGSPNWKTKLLLGRSLWGGISSTPTWASSLRRFSSYALCLSPCPAQLTPRSPPHFPLVLPAGPATGYGRGGTCARSGDRGGFSAGCGRKRVGCSPGCAAGVF